MIDIVRCDKEYYSEMVPIITQKGSRTEARMVSGRACLDCDIVEKIEHDQLIYALRGGYYGTYK